MANPANPLARRRVEPELLDHLPSGDPAAIGSRRDLAWINALMFQSAIMARLFRTALRKGRIRVLEIGAGDGAFMLAAARRLAGNWSGVELLLLDRIDLVTDARRADFARLGWRAEAVTADVFEWLVRPGIGTFDAISANLFLHHFSDAELKRLFAALSRLAPVFLATEPERNAVALKACSLLRVIGANQVTLHDAAASVRAGFADKELSSLWPAEFRHRCEERRVGPFTHAFRVAGPEQP
jgi:hypothetical protein